MANYRAVSSGSPLCNRAPTALQLMAHKPHRKRQLRRDRSDVVVDASKTVWVQTVNKSALTAAVESGFDTMVFEDRVLIEEWEKLAKFQAVVLDGEDIWDRDGGHLGAVRKIRDGEDLKKLMSQELPQGVVVMDASDWQIIPAENLVAAAQQQERPVQLLAVTSTATEARAMMEALEVGTGGVVLRTDDPSQVRELAVWMAQQVGQGCALELESARVVTVGPVGMGDRACVDLCSLCRPGEGLLVGSFARALFLVHSECAESSYINSRPFRVNAGPVHSYLQAPGDRTAYLSELQCGSEVLVVDAHGRPRTAIVGRVKIERRPLVLVTAETQDGQQHSSLLQNAETVKLVGPSSSTSGWQAVPVTQMEPGQELLLLRQAAARHTGMSIEESIIER